MNAVNAEDRPIRPGIATKSRYLENRPMLHGSPEAWRDDEEEAIEGAYRPGPCGLPDRAGFDRCQMEQIRSELDEVYEQANEPGKGPKGSIPGRIVR